MSTRYEFFRAFGNLHPFKFGLCQPREIYDCHTPWHVRFWLSHTVTREIYDCHTPWHVRFMTVTHRDTWYFDCHTPWHVRFMTVIHRDTWYFDCNTPWHVIFLIFFWFFLELKSTQNRGRRRFHTKSTSYSHEIPVSLKWPCLYK